MKRCPPVPGRGRLAGGKSEMSLIASPGSMNTAVDRPGARASHASSRTASRGGSQQSCSGWQGDGAGRGEQHGEGARPGRHGPDPEARGRGVTSRTTPDCEGPAGSGCRPWPRPGRERPVEACCWTAWRPQTVCGRLESSHRCALVRARAGASTRPLLVAPAPAPAGRCRPLGWRSTRQTAGWRCGRRVAPNLR